MSTTLFKKLVLYGCILVGLGGFGFAQEQNSCTIDSDCTAIFITQCCGRGREVCMKNDPIDIEKTRKDAGLICQAIDCENRYDAYIDKLESCKCQNNKCTSKYIKIPNPVKEIKYDEDDLSMYSPKYQKIILKKRRKEYWESKYDKYIKPYQKIVKIITVFGGILLLIIVLYKISNYYLNPKTKNDDDRI